MANKQIAQHKRLAMGEDTGHTTRVAKFAKGGGVNNLKTGIKDSPITVAKMNNGVPGFKKGGKSC